MPPATWTKLTDGVWVDAAGALHIYVDQLLEANGFEATPENIDRVTRTAEAMARGLGADYTERD